MNQYQSGSTISGQLAHCEQLVQQLAQQTQQASMQYEQLLQQEQNNAIALEQIAQRERHAAHVIQTALQGHQTVLQQLQHITGLCNQIANSVSHQTTAYGNATGYQSQGYTDYSRH